MAAGSRGAVIFASDCHNYDFLWCEGGRAPFSKTMSGRAVPIASDVATRLGTRSSEGISAVAMSVPSACGIPAYGAGAPGMNSRCPQDDWKPNLQCRHARIPPRARSLELVWQRVGEPCQKRPGLRSKTLRQSHELGLTLLRKWLIFNQTFDVFSKVNY